MAVISRRYMGGALPSSSAGCLASLLAVIVRLFISEPRERLGFPAASTEASPMREMLGALWRKSSYRYAVVGVCLYFFMAYGALIFMPSFYVRVLGVSLAEMGSAYGSVSAASALIGTLGGGFLADRLAGAIRAGSPGYQPSHAQ